MATTTDIKRIDKYILTKAQYDEIVAAGTVDANAEYYVTDAAPIDIDETVTADSENPVTSKAVAAYVKANAVSAATLHTPMELWFKGATYNEGESTYTDAQIAEINNTALTAAVNTIGDSQWLPFCIGGEYTGANISDDERACCENGLNYGFLNFSAVDNTYTGFIFTLGMNSMDDVMFFKAFVDNEGYLSVEKMGSGGVDASTIATLMKPVRIQSSDTSTATAANRAAIKAYTDILESLGFDLTKGFQMPVYETVHSRVGLLSSVGNGAEHGDVLRLSGFLSSVGGEDHLRFVSIIDGSYTEKLKILDDDYSLTTTSKSVVGAINELNSKMGGGSSVTTDTAMSDTSENPVQNKVIKAYIDGLVGNVATQLSSI